MRSSRSRRSTSTSQPPVLREGLVRSALAAMRRLMPEFYDTLYGQDPADGQHYFRLMLRVHERQTAQQKQQLIDQLQNISQQHFPRRESPATLSC